MKIDIINDMDKNRIFKSGKYVVGDLCYILNETDEAQKRWREMLEYKIANDWDFIGEIATTKGKYPYALLGTLYGDGSYPLYVNDEYIKHLSVDAGMIGCIPIDIFEDEDLKNIFKPVTDENDWLVAIVDFKDDFKIDTIEKKMDVKDILGPDEFIRYEDYPEDFNKMLDTKIIYFGNKTVVYTT